MIDVNHGSSDAAEWRHFLQDFQNDFELTGPKLKFKILMRKA